MNSVAVQTDLREDEETALNSITMGIFADILNILDDENHKIYYDISETFTCPDSKWSAEADAGDLAQDFLPSVESQQVSERAFIVSGSRTISTSDIHFV